MMDYATVATDMFELSDVDMTGRTEYLTVMDFLGTMIVNAQEEGEPFGRVEAMTALTELEVEIAGIKEDIGEKP
jgi:hypothetical protein